MTNTSAPDIAAPARNERPDVAREQTDNWVGKVQYRVPADELRKLSSINPWVSTLHIALEWLFVVGAIWLCTQFWNPILYILTVMWIGARQHALLILMHEGTHYRLFRRKWLNDLISEFFLAWPNFITTHAYRVSHFAHHRNINTDEDPDWVRKKNHEWEFPKSWRQLGKILVKDILGLNSHQILAEVLDLSDVDHKETAVSIRYSVARIAYYVAAISVLAYFNLLVGFLLFWVVPFATWFKVIIRIRGIAEHYGLDESAYGLSRTTLLSWFDRLFVAPNNINYHLEHHLYPSVPFYRLPQLHKSLMSLPGYRDDAHVTQTYWGVLRECVNSSKQKVL